jgi:predicted RNase H-like HicB family nuclease
VDGKVNIEYTTYIWQEKDQYIAHAMPLDVMSAGKTVDQAREALAEAIELFLETAVENGTLTDVLSEAGYRLEQGQWVSPSWVSIERHSIPLAA